MDSNINVCSAFEYQVHGHPSYNIVAWAECGYHTIDRTDTSVDNPKIAASPINNMYLKDNYSIAACKQGMPQDPDSMYRSGIGNKAEY
jgi:hypothetical protein